jgi:DNA invertase Pin-like site-specific DNA recombinase
MRIALYARCSTRNKDQNPETQLLPLRDYAKHRGFEIQGEYVDHGFSGAKDKRPALDRLMAAVRKRHVDGVLVLKFDRFARSTRHLVLTLEEFQSLGVAFISLTEAVDTSTPAGKLMYTMISAFAEFERAMIQERICFGLDRARREGKTLGRKRAIVDREKVRTMHAVEGLGVRAIAEQMGVSKSLVANILRAPA